MTCAVIGAADGTAIGTTRGGGALRYITRHTLAEQRMAGLNDAIVSTHTVPATLIIGRALCAQSIIADGRLAGRITAEGLITALFTDPCDRIAIGTIWAVISW